MLDLRSLATAAALALALAGPAASGEVVDAATEAERLVAEGRNREAWDRLDAAAGRIWATAPLEFRRLLFVAAEPQGLGVYEPRPGNTFKPGEVLRVYGEPFGFGHARDGEFHRIEFEVRLSVTSPDGAELIAPRAGRLQLKSRLPNREFMLHFFYEPKGLKPGDYLLVADVRDTSTGKTTNARLPFRIE